MTKYNMNLRNMINETFNGEVVNESNDGNLRKILKGKSKQEVIKYMEMQLKLTKEFFNDGDKVDGYVKGAEKQLLHAKKYGNMDKYNF